MANTITQTDVLNSLHNLMGHRVNPGGTDDDFKRYIQDSFDYCWRYYKWNWTTKTFTTLIDGLLPTDFDPLGYNSLDQDVYSITFDSTSGKYMVNPAGVVDITYQAVPPTLSDTTGQPFPSSMVVAIGSTVLAKQGENPTRADVKQEWDMWHARLDRLVGQVESNVSRRPRNFHDVAGTFPGDTGS